MSGLKEKLVQLHENMADLMLQMLGDEEPSPALLNTIRQFLKDNNIDVMSGTEGGSKLDHLAKVLPFQDPEEPISRAGGDQ